MVLLLFICIFPSHCGGQLAIVWRVGYRMVFSASHSSGSVSTSGSTEDGSVAILIYQSISALTHFGKSITTEAFGLNASNHPRTYQVSSLFPSPALAHVVLSTFMAEHVAGQFRLLILVVPCWTQAAWLPTVLNMLEDVPY